MTLNDDVALNRACTRNIRNGLEQVAILRYTAGQVVFDFNVVPDGLTLGAEEEALARWVVQALCAPQGPPTQPSVHEDAVVSDATIVTAATCTGTFAVESKPLRLTDATASAPPMPSSPLPMQVANETIPLLIACKHRAFVVRSIVCNV